ncbi:hypothetical protein EI74_0697 [Mycoplasma testudineum]|uniref:Uncharacterized protein n=1 Tax=Mycoplasma testudineum TaxID=244584 RepID=A0A4R6ICR0_9MOLU|nr:hypothetical protein [Mycoplasma testudineum]OYD26594.1 hypothetical protein CG473_03080 [Mycoplasma testudineum]TDO19426.1 hypothetical protein EI74_0697 [Mycoplasma testudineum]
MSNFGNYIPNMAIFGFGDCKTNELYDLKFEYKSQITFARFGKEARDISAKIGKHEHFFDWSKKARFSNQISKDAEKPEKVFLANEQRLKQVLAPLDLIIIPINTRNTDSVIYAAKFIEYIKSIGEDILVITLVVNSIFNSAKLRGHLTNLRNSITKTKNILVDTHEIDLINAYKNSSFPKRDKYVLLGLTNIVNQLIGAFSDVVNNPRLYTRIKAQSYLRKSNKPDTWLVSIGTSNVAEERFEKALFQAINNPIFHGGVSSSNKFLMIITGTFLDEKNIRKTKQILQNVVGLENEPQVILARVVQDYEFENVVTVTIFARDVVELEKVVKDSNTQPININNSLVHEITLSTKKPSDFRHLVDERSIQGRLLELLKKMDIKDEKTQEIALGRNTDNIKFDSIDN